MPPATRRSPAFRTLLVSVLFGAFVLGGGLLSATVTGSADESSEAPSATATTAPAVAPPTTDGPPAPEPSGPNGDEAVVLTGTELRASVDPGSDGALALLDHLRVRLVEQGGCAPGGDGVEQVTVPGVSAEAQLALTKALDALDRAAEACSVDEDAWAGQVGRAIRQLGRFEAQLGSTEPPVPVKVGNVASLAAAAVSQHDRLYALLSDRNTVDQSPYFFSPMSEHKLLELRALVAEGKAPTTFVVGNSIANRGIDVTKLRYLGHDVYNASAQGSSPEIQRLSVENITGLTEVEHIVWVLRPEYVAEPCRIDSRADDIRQRRADVFSGVPAAERINELDLILGTDPIRPARDVPSYIPTDPEQLGPYGNVDGLVGVKQSRIDNQTEDTLAAPPEGICGPRSEFMTDTVSEWRSQGIEVLTVVAPASPRLIELIGGEPVITELTGAIEDATLAGGGTFVDLSRSVDADGFQDLIHTNLEGRPVFTDLIASELGTTS